jgi:hypothetical protein
MALRFLTAILLSIAGLVILAWPASRVGLHLVEERATTTSRISLEDRSLRFESRPAAARPAVARDRYLAQVGPIARDLPPTGQQQVAPANLANPPAAPPAPSVLRLFRPQFNQTATTTSAAIPLPLLLLISLVALIPLITADILRTRRRRRRHHCLACGYQRVPDDNVCTECGLTPAAAASHPAIQRSLALRDAGILLFVILFAISGLAWLTLERDERTETMHRAHVFDYGWYADATLPRLTGAVAVATPDTLEHLLRTSPPGTIVVLTPGEYNLGNRYTRPGRDGMRQLEDLWLLGGGVDRDSTTLSMELEQATRVRIQNLTIDCQDKNPFLNLRRGGEIQLNGCLVRNYNSGAGGSNAIFGADAILLIEDCEFEGESGRASGRRSGGTAMDLRGGDRLFIRNATFTDNSHIFRRADAILDNCTISFQPQSYSFLPASAGVFMRNTTIPDQSRRFAPQTLPLALTEMLDDPAVLRRLGSRRTARSAQWADMPLRDAAITLALWSNAAFWENLLLHPSPEVRQIAASRATPRLATLPEAPLESALAALREPVITPAATITLLRQPQQSRPELEHLAATGTTQQKRNAAAILQLMDCQPPVLHLIEHAARRTAE